jgi:hypothetical protein
MMRTVLFAVLLGTAAHGAPAARDACQLLSRRDVAAVQGQAFRSTKLTESSDESMSISQCFYELPAFDRSVSVTVMRPRADAPRNAAAEYWKRHFVSAARDEGEERELRTKAVGGIGEAAVWSGNRFVGALYVFRGDSIFRISVGGPESEAQKIVKSKRLARRVAGRL